MTLLAYMLSNFRIFILGLRPLISILFLNQVIFFGAGFPSASHFKRILFPISLVVFVSFLIKRRNKLASGDPEVGGIPVVVVVVVVVPVVDDVNPPLVVTIIELVPSFSTPSKVLKI